MLKILKGHQKQEIDLKPLKTMRRVFYFKLGIGNSVERFQRKFIFPSYLSTWNGYVPCKHMEFQRNSIFHAIKAFNNCLKKSREYPQLLKQYDILGSSKNKLSLETFKKVVYCQPQIKHAPCSFQCLNWLKVDPLFLMTF